MLRDCVVTSVILNTSVVLCLCLWCMREYGRK